MKNDQATRREIEEKIEAVQLVYHLPILRAAWKGKKTKEKKQPSKKYGGKLILILLGTLYLYSTHKNS